MPHEPRPDYRSKSLHMLFDMAEPEYKIQVVSPMNIHHPEIMKRIEGALGHIGLIEITQGKRVPMSDEVQDHFPAIEFSPLYFIDAVVERLPGGVDQVAMLVADYAGYKTQLIKILCDDARCKAPEPSDEPGTAFLGTEMGDHPSEKDAAAVKGDELHGPKRIAAIMKAMARTDEEKYGERATTTFAASSAVLKEMSDAPIRKGVWRCSAANGELILERRLETPDDTIPYYSRKEEIAEAIERTRVRSFLETIDYETAALTLLREKVETAFKSLALPTPVGFVVEGNETGITVNAGVISASALASLPGKLSEQGVHVSDVLVSQMNPNQSVIILKAG